MRTQKRTYEQLGNIGFQEMIGNEPKIYMASKEFLCESMFKKKHSFKNEKSILIYYIRN